MKKLITIILLLFTVVACKEENNPFNKLKEATDKVKEAKQEFGNINEIVKGAEDLQENVEKLAKMTPMTKEAMKSWMPESIGSLERTKYDIGKQMGIANISTLSMEFKGEDSKRIRLNITDGAGNGASVISMFIMMKNADVDSESETGYERTETFGNQKVLIKYSNPKYNNSSKFSYLVNDRLFVEATGFAMEPEELWEYLEKLEIEELLSN